MTDGGAETRGLPHLTTERLLLRPFVRADAPEVERLAGAWEVAETTLNVPHPYPPNAASAWIDSHAPAWQSGTRLTLAISPREDPDALVGAIALGITSEHARAELGYWIGRAFWNRGYATEAARAIVDFGFATLGLNRIQAQHFVRNAASGRVMEKIGMHKEGVRRQAYRRFDRFEDVALWAILASDRASQG
jgi:RimJ/RimL family protein N-acetyltransferase